MLSSTRPEGTVRAAAPGRSFTAVRPVAPATSGVNDPQVNEVGGATSGVDQALGRDRDQKGPHGELKST